MKRLDIWLTDEVQRDMKENDVASLYNLICRHCPDNDWTDICCDNVVYKPDVTEIHVTIM
jgi:hypothetical protein